jgi:hypothetical protein
MAATYGQGAVSYLPGVGDLMKLGMTPERFEEVQAPIIDAAVAGRDLITDPAAMANMAYKYPLEVSALWLAFRLWSARVETSSAHLGPWTMRF